MQGRRVSQLITHFKRSRLLAFDSKGIDGIDQLNMVRDREIFDDRQGLIEIAFDLDDRRLVHHGLRQFPERDFAGGDQHIDGQPGAGGYREHDILVITDTHATERWAQHPMVTMGPRVRFYAGVPLVIELFRRVGAAQIVEAQVRLKQRQRGLTAAQLVETLLALWAAGGDRCQDLQTLRADAALAALQARLIDVAAALGLLNPVIAGAAMAMSSG